MRIRIEQARDADRGCAEAEHAAPVPVGPASGDPVRDALSALRAARRRGQATAVDAAVEALSARASDPLGASLSPPRLGGESRELDDKDASDRESEQPDTASRLQLGGAPPGRPPEIRLLAIDLDDQVMQGAARRASGDAASAESEDKPKLPEVTRGERSTEPGRADKDPAHAGRHARHPDHARAMREARIQAEQRQKKIDKRAKGLAAGPRPTDDKQPKKPGAKGAVAATPVPKLKAPAKQPRAAKDKGGGGGGGGDPVEAWHGRVVAKANAITAPPLSDEDRYVYNYQAATTKAAKQTPAEKIKLIKTAQDAVPPVDKFQGQDDDLKLPSPDPMPEKRQAVLDKTRRTLKPQSLPDLDRSPLRSLPELGTMVYSEEGSGTKHVLRELAPGEGYAEIVIVPTGGKPPPVLKGMKTEVREDKKLEDGKGTLSDRLKAHNAKEPRNITGKGGTGNAKGATISNDMPKGTPKLPRLESIPKVDTGKVIAAVMAQTDPASKGIVDGALDVFPGNKPLKAAAGFTDVFVPPVKADILKEMQRIAGKAGSGADAIKSKVDAEKEKADAAAAANQAALDDASKGAKNERWRFSEQIADHIGGLLDDMERTIDDQTAIAKGGFDPKAVKAEERQLRDTNETMVSTWLTNYSTLKKNRTDSLIKEQTRQTNAYQATAELDKQTLDKKAGDKPDQATTDDVTRTKTEVDKWLSDHLTDVPKKVTDLIAESAADIATYKRELKSAADDYDTEIQNWAKDRIHREKSWWKKLIDVIKDWLGVVTTEKKNWQERSNTDNETTLANDEAELDLMIVNDTGDQTEESIKARKDLSEAQKAIALSYFTGAHHGDSAVALAAGLIVQLGSQWRPQIVKQIETKVLGSADQLIIDVANATPGFDVDNHVTEIISGFKGAGTDKDKVYGALKTKTGTMTRIQARAVELRYRERTNSSLRSDINSELYDVGDMIASIVPGSSGHADENRAFALLDADEDASAKEIAAQLDAAMHKNAWGTGLGTDKETIYKLLRGKNAEERAAIKAAYREMTGKELDKDVEAELDDGVSPVYDVNQYYALMRGDKEGADAIGMRRAHGWVSDNWVDKQINKVMFQDVKVADQVYQDIRTDVDADAAAASAAGRPWDNAEYDRQLKRRLDSLDKKFGDQFGYDFNVKPGQSALEAAHQTMGGDKAKMLIGERRNDLAMESAARISIEHKALILPDKAEVNKALEAQYNRAFAEERRTLENAEQLEQKNAWDDCTVKPKSESTADKLQAEKETEQRRKQWRKDWLDPDGKAKRKRELDRKAEAKAAESTKTKMSALKTTYEKEFGSGSMFSTGSFEGDVHSATNVTWPGQRNADNDKTKALIAGSGYLTPDQQLLFGVKGAGTSEEAVRKAYAGRTRAEIAQIHRDLQARLTKIGVTDTAVDWVLDDFSGSELDDIKVEQMGEPTNNVERVEVEKERARLQKESVKRTTTGDYILGALTGVPPGALSSMRNYMSEDDNKYIDGRIAKLEQSIADLETEKERLKKAGINEGDQEWYDKLAPFRDRIEVNTEGVKIGVEGNRATLNAAVSWATVGIQVVVGIATLIAGIVLTPVTGGLSTAIAIAVIGALVTAAATMAAKAAFKGGAYGWEEAAQDGAMAMVDALAAGLTAGFGSKILGGLQWAAKEAESVLMETVKRVVNAAIQKTIGHFVMGALQAAPSALIGAMIEGGDLMTALEGILQAGVMSVVVSNATEGITAHFQNAKVLAARTNPEAFKAALAHYASEHPSIPPHELPGRLRAELDQALFAHNRDAFKEPAMQDKLRAEMFEGMPANLRGEYANAKIEMKTPAEINALAGNPKAESAVVMKNGTPTVAIKAGAVLGEVGASLPALPRTPAAAPKPGTPIASPTTAPPPHAAAPKPTAPPAEHATAPSKAAPPAEHAAAPPKAAPPVEHAEAPVPHGGSATPDPRAPVESGAAPPKKLIVEPLAGPKLESAIDLALKNPDANVVATERSIKPPAGEIARAEKAGVSFIPENKTPALAPGSVDEMKMRFPIPHERTAEQDWHMRLAEVEQTHPNLDRFEQYKLASKMTEDLAESLTGYGPYALERLKPGGKLEVVFHEPSIMGELGDVSRMRFIDPQTGKGYRLEVVDIQIRTRGEVAPHSGFGIPEMTHATEVRVARFEKIELETKLPTGARGADIASGDVVGKFSGRQFTPSEAGGPIRELDYSKIKFTERAVEVVEAHVRRFDGGGEMELAMVDRLRAIAAGKLEATEFDRAFFSHELRESVRYRQLGLHEGQPIDPAKAYEIWNNAHSATLEDYRLHERLPGGGRSLFHPEVTARFEPVPTGGRGPSYYEALASKALGPEGELHPSGRKGMVRELGDLGIPREQLRAMSDHELAARYFEAQVQEAPRRIAAYRETLPLEARAELDALQGAPELHAKPVDADLAGRLHKAIDTPIKLDATLPFGEIRVGADGVTLHVGPGATVGDVLGHIPTVGALKRYQGALGMVRQIGDAIGRVFGRGGPPFGSNAHEAWLEIQKLPARIESRRLELLDHSLDFETRLRLQEEITRIEGQLARHAAALGDLSPGRGYVAMEGDPKPPARSRGKAAAPEPVGKKSVAAVEAEPTTEGGKHGEAAKTSPVQEAKEKLEQLQKAKETKQAELEALQKEHIAAVEEHRTALADVKQAVAEWDAAAKAFTAEKSSAATLEEAVRPAREKARIARERVKTALEAIEELPGTDSLKSDLKKLNAAIEVESIKANPESRAALPCFAAETPIATPHGTRWISELRAGDEVWTYDFSTGTRQARPIVQCHRGLAKVFYRVQIGADVVRATSQHRFWVDSEAAWRKAESLEPGMRLRTLDGGSAIVAAIDQEHCEEATFNVTIEELDSYFVGPGVLVHNSAVDVGLGGGYLIYRMTNPSYPGKVYIGQTTELDQQGKPRGTEKRGKEHRDEAIEALENDRLGIEKLSPQDRLFHEFMKDPKTQTETIIKGIATKEQADYLEQRNIGLERVLDENKGNVLNRRNQITSEDHMKEVVDAIKNDPAVKAKGYCP